MVAVINAGKSLKNILNYNEQKVHLGKAELLQATHFAKDTQLLLFKDKMGTFQKLTSLNHRTKINAVHISLNFASSDGLNSEKFKKIADSYLKHIGFGEQPYLVYQHHDAGHPHLHIVTTNIEGDGTRISLHNIGRMQSESARRKIEQEFDLLPAQHQKKTMAMKPVNVPKAEYGKSETKEAIQRVLDAVLLSYKYTSLDEVNAVLKAYNVLADRGGEKSRMYKHGGLVYRLLNEGGKKVGAPIKASLLQDKPTLAFLGAKFIQNGGAKQGHQVRVKNAVDLFFVKHPNPAFQTLQQALAKQQISLTIQQNKTAVIQGMTYVDHKTKCVFSGSELGMHYNVSGIQQRCNGTTLVQSISDIVKQKQKRKKQQHL